MARTERPARRPGFPGRGCSYGEMLDFLWPIQGRLGVRFGLRNIGECLRRLGRPERRFLSAHVAGTKGKGSTAAILQAILDAAGHRTGLYTSPHLLDFRERFVVGRSMAEHGELVEVFREVARVTGGGQDPPLTFFEWCTAMAFLLFARRGVEVAVLEAGMGGRLDATRAAGGPLALFSLIGLDHQAYLGETPEAIAREKAGLMTRGGHAITAAQTPGVTRVLRRRAAALGVELISLEEMSRLTVHGTDLAGVSFDLVLPGRRLARLFCPLPGRHQAGNAALAVAGLGCLERLGFGADDRAVAAGLASVRWPGRLETAGEAPTVILDAAHNPDSMRSLTAFLGEVFPGRPPAFVLGILADKDIPGMMRVLAPLSPDVWLAPCRSDRAAGVDAMAAAAAAAGLRIAGTGADVAAALEQARRSRPEGPVVVTGSLFTVAEAKAALTGTRATLLPGHP